MHKLHKRMLVAVVAALALVAAAVPAWAGGTKPDVAVFDPRTDVVETFLDLGEEGLSAGDTILEKAQLVSPHTGEHVGQAITRIQIVEVLEQPSEEHPDGNFLFILDCTVELEEGSLTFYGAGIHLDAAEGLHFALTGGTGKYAGVSGETVITFTEVNGQEGPLLEFFFA